MSHNPNNSGCPRNNPRNQCVCTCPKDNGASQGMGHKNGYSFDDAMIVVIDHIQYLRDNDRGTIAGAIERVLKGEVIWNHGMAVSVIPQEGCNLRADGRFFGGVAITPVCDVCGAEIIQIGDEFMCTGCQKALRGKCGVEDLHEIPTTPMEQYKQSIPPLCPHCSGYLNNKQLENLAKKPPGTPTRCQNCNAEFTLLDLEKK